MRTVAGLSAGTATYAYNADGTRRSKTYNSVTASYYYDGDQEIVEYQASSVERRYIRLPGSVDEAFLMIDYTMDAGCTNTSYANCEVWAHQNRLGSVVATTDDAGAVIDEYTYSPYGVSGGSNSGFPFRFTGQKIDTETGLYYYKARYYDPETGRFMQTDPIGYDDQMNLYAYVGNDPVNFADPSGEYGRGKGWGNRWGRFRRLQNQAATRLQNGLNDFKKTRESDPDKAKEQFEEQFGEGTGTTENMDAVVKNTEDMIAALESNDASEFVAHAYDADDFAALPGDADPDALARNAVGDNVMHVNRDHGRFNDDDVLRWTVGHESGHAMNLEHGTGSVKVGENSYKAVTPYLVTMDEDAYQAYQNLSPAYSLKNPDKHMEFSYGSVPRLE